MTHERDPQIRYVSGTTKSFVGLMVVAGIGCWHGHVLAQSTATEARTLESVTHFAEMTDTDLERAFWICDHAATTGRVDIGAAGMCSTVTDTLSKRRFNGEFSALLAWWRVHKTAQHEAIEQAQHAFRTAAGELERGRSRILSPR